MTMENAEVAPSLIRQRQGLSYFGAVTTATSTTVMAILALAGFGNDFFKGYWATPVWDAGGAGAAPQGEWRQITDYVSSTGALTHAAFSAQPAVTDKILLVHPSVYQSIMNAGGPVNMAQINSEQRAGLDFARVQTIASPVTLITAAQYIYQRSGSDRPFYFAGGFLSQDSGGWAGGESVEITVDMQVDGTNWENVWSLTLAAAGSPLSIAVPSHANSALLNIPYGFWVGANNGVRVGIGQSGTGGGLGVWSHNFVDGVPRT